MRVRVVLVVLAIIGSLFGAAHAENTFPLGPPNDPLYDQAEEAPEQYGVNSEQWYLYSFMPKGAPLAKDPENAAGMSVDRAWRDFSIGTPDTVIAYVEGGINWHADNVKEIADKVYLNRDELGNCMAGYQDNGDPWFNALDFPAVPEANGNGFVDAEDVIVACSNGADDDGNGYVDDISGWDFYNDQNDPGTVDSAYTHPNAQMGRAAALTNNGIGGASPCPLCTLMPIKGGAEALDRSDDLARAWIYATDQGADVVVSETAAMGYSSFLTQAAEHIAHSGSVLVESSNDFDSTDHQGGMWHPHSIPGNSVVTDIAGAPTNPLTDRSITTFRARSGFSSWGTHNMFSFSSIKGTTSEVSGVAGGVLGLVMSYGREAAAQGLIARPLTGLEAAQVLRESSSDVDDASLSWPGKPGWDVQYGYGRPNVHKALDAISRGDIPPVASIESPRWFSLFDPKQESSVEVTGVVDASRAESFRWAIEAGIGAEPESFFTLGKGVGEGAGSVSATLSMSDIPKSFWKAAFKLSKTKALESSEQFTVTLRLRAWDDEDRLGEDRRTIAVHHDPAALSGFPKRIGAGGEGQPALMDLNSDGRKEIVFADSDGVVHALDFRTGNDISGWPVKTDALAPLRGAAASGDVVVGNEPVPNSIAVGDVDGDGAVEVVATSTNGKTYVWEATGARAPGWPRALDKDVTRPAIPRPNLAFTRLPIQGAFSSPVLADLNGDSAKEIIQAGWDGFMHAWTGDGADLPGWPVKVVHPDHAAPLGRDIFVNDQKLSSTPAIANLDGAGPPEVVIRSQYFHTLDKDLQPAGVAHVYAWHANGEPVQGWPVEIDQLFVFYGSAQEFITEGASSVVAADVEGDGRDEVAVSLMFSPTWLLDGSGRTRGAYGTIPNPTADVVGGQSPLTVTERQVPVDAPVSFTTSGAFGRFGGVLSYAESASNAASTGGALLLPGGGMPIRNAMRAFDAVGGAPHPGFPAWQQGLNFLGSPAIADVTGDGKPEILGAADSSAFHAWSRLGKQAPGFPKFTSGWALWGPSVGDLNGDGLVEVVLTAREGYLFVWRTPGLTSGLEWASWRADPANTGHYSAD
ncbi:MAG: FG-GAP-like repeat-containing protein [Actinomycetota bacterium]